MRAIGHVFFDESGNTGQNLADLSQPVFSLASTTVDESEAIRLLQPFAVLNQAEVKYSKVRKTTMGQRLIIDFLKDPVVVGEFAKIYVVNKPFMIVSKIVDMIYEPQVHAMGENFYEKKAALATANLISLVYPVFGGRTRFYRLLELFVKAVRSKDDESITRFFRDAKSFKDHVEEKHGEDNAAQLIPILYEEHLGAPNLRSGRTDELDPIVPSFMVHAAHWSRESNQRFAVVSDDSSTLERNQQVFLDYSNPLGTPMSADYYGDKIEYPLKIDRFEFVDSQTQPSIRIADLLAGIASDAFTPMANRERQSPYQKSITQPLLDHGLILNALWPGDDVTPEALNAASESQVNPVQVAVDFVTSVKAASGEKPNSSESQPN